ncbi:MAG: gamma-glutamyltransferase [Myxococcota bacterium]
MVAADHALASEAGAEALRRGGNAVDAAVAAALAAGVVQPAGSGLGGGGFAIGRLAGGEPFALDFREVAPAAATAEMFRIDGIAADASTRGGMAVAVIGEPRGLATLVRTRGKLSLREVAAPAIRLASKGFEVGPHLASALASSDFPAITAVFSVSGPGGRQVARRGEVVTRRALAGTLDRWVKTNGDVLNTGDGARQVVEAVKAAGGGMTVEDLANHRPKDREPLVGKFGKYTVITMPPPSSGGVALLEALRVLEGYDLAALGFGSSDYVHLVTEVLKHVFADRANLLGDPDFVEVPVDRLLSPDRTGEIHRAIWPGRTFPPEAYGEVAAPPVDAGTQHISVVDRSGGAVGLTTTINTSFGSGVVVEGLGVILNDQMDDFAAAPGVPNAFGLVGNAANAIAPGTHPLSSMSPTVVLDGDKVVLVVGASGGSTIISGTLEVLLDVLVFGMDAEEAVSAPRFHHQWLPNTLTVEPGTPDDVVRALTARGHQVTVRELPTAVQVVTVGPDGRIEGASDPRKGGRPATP